MPSLSLGLGFARGPVNASAPTLPLDGLSAAMAYSTRRLRTAYTGAALRVRRSSDNTEQDIGFSGNALDTTALTAFVGANTGWVVTWYDQSGNARNLTPQSVNGRPKIIQTGTLETLGSKPAVFFDGTGGGSEGDHLRGDPILYAAGAMTAIITTDMTTTPNSGNFFGEYAAGAGTAAYTISSNNLALGRMFAIGRNDANTAFLNFVNFGDGYLNGTAKNIVVRDGGAALEVFENGTRRSNPSYTRSGVLTLAHFTLGAQWNGSSTQVAANGRIAEAIFFTSAISNADMNTVAIAQGTEFGFTVNPF